MAYVQEQSEFARRLNQVRWEKIGDDVAAELWTDDIRVFSMLSFFEFGVDPTIAEIDGGHCIKFSATDLPRLRAGGVRFPGAECEQSAARDAFYLQ